jgi:hypothetical protein
LLKASKSSRNSTSTECRCREGQDGILHGENDYRAEPQSGGGDPEHFFAG